MTVKNGSVTGYSCVQCFHAATNLAMNLAWGGDGKVLPVHMGPPKKVRRPLPIYPCIHRGEPTGERVKCGTCGGGTQLPVLTCGLFGKCTAALPANEGGIQCCRDCKSRVPPEVAALSTFPAGVVIGSYKWPSLVELQIKLIRETCGAVPILVSSDHPESAARISAICDRFPDVRHWPNPDRIGHTGGDVAAFFKAAIWGADRGVKVVAKLSQRFLVTKEGWLQEGAADLLASGLSLATQRCTGTQRFDLRTEACLVDVKQWNTPDVIARILPRRYWTDSPKGLTAETVIARVLQDLTGEFFWPWSLFGEDRGVRYPGVVWHNSHSDADYKKLAAEHGVTLERDFHVAGWQQDQAKGQYLYG